MIDCANCGLLSIIVKRKHSFQHRLPCFIYVVVKRSVFLFIYGFKLCMEQAKNGIAEPFRLYRQKFIYGVRWDVFFINRFFNRRMSICALGAHRSQHLIVFTRQRILRCYSRDTVDRCI